MTWESVRYWLYLLFINAVADTGNHNEGENDEPLDGDIISIMIERRIKREMVIVQLTIMAMI